MTLAEWLEKTGVSVERLAEAADVSGPSVRNVLAGKWVSLKTAYKIREATLGAVGIEDMLGDRAALGGATGGARFPAASADRGDESEGMA